MTRRIDAHQHFWRVERGDYDWLTPDLAPLFRDFGAQDLAPLLEAARVDATVLVQAAQTLAETRFLLDIAARTPWVAGVVGWIDFAAPSAPDDLAELAENPKLVGVRPMIQDIPDDNWILRRDLDAAFAAVAELGLVFDALVHPRHLKNLLQRLTRHPDLAVVIDHCAKPRIREALFEPWVQDIAGIARETAACCKVSGLVTEAAPGWTEADLEPYFDHVRHEFGGARLLWGSDWPVLTQASSYARWMVTSEHLAAGLPAERREDFFGGNAIRIYRLDAPGRLRPIREITV